VQTLASPAMGSVARAPSTVNCLIFQVTSEPHKLSDIRLVVVSYPVKIYRLIALSLFIAWIP